MAENKKKSTIREYAEAIIIALILALFINELINPKFKKVIQTVFYIPHFFSWVIIAGLTFDVLAMDGIVNHILEFFGASPIIFMQSEAYFRPIYVLTSIWRDAGWGTIVYLASLFLKPLVQSMRSTHPVGARWGRELRD